MNYAPQFAFLTLALPGLPQVPTLETLSVNGDADADAPSAAAWSLDGEVLLVAHELTNDVVFLDPGVRTRVTVGGGPLDVQVCPTSGRAFVPNSKDDTVSVIDVDLAEVIATIPLTGSFPSQVEIASHGALAVVSCVESDSLSILDLISLQEVGTIPTVEQGPISDISYTRERYRRMDLGPDNRTLALPGIGSMGVYDVSTGQALFEAPIPGPYNLSGYSAGVGPSGRYIAWLFRDSFRSFPNILDLQTGAFGSICGDFYYACPDGDLVVSPNEEIAVISAVDGGMDFIDMETGLSIGSLPGEGSAVDLSPDGRLAYVGGYSHFVLGFAMTVVDTQTMSVLGRVPLDSPPGDRVYVHPSGQRAASLERLLHERSVWVDWDGRRLEEVANVSTGTPPEGDGPWDLAGNAAGDLLVSANYVSGTMTILEPDTGAASVLELSGSPRVVRMDDAGRLAVVAQGTDEPLTIVDLENRRIAAELPCRYAQEIEVSADGKRIVTVQLHGDSRFVDVIDCTDPYRPTAIRIDVPGVGNLNGARLSISRDGIVAVPQATSDQITFIDSLDGTILGTLPFFNDLRQVAFSPDGRYLYATGANNFRRARVSRHRIEWLDSVGHGTGGVQELLISRDGRLAFLTKIGSVTIIATESMEVRSSLLVPGNNYLIDQVGQRLILGSRFDTELGHVRFDGSGQATLAEPISVTAPPRDLLAVPGQRLYAIGVWVDSLDVFDFSTDERLNPVEPSATVGQGKRRETRTTAPFHDR